MTDITPQRLRELEAYQSQQRSDAPAPSVRKSTPNWATFKQLLPAEMLKEKRFVRYFLKPKPEGGTAKIPLGNHSDPSTWATFYDAVDAIQNDQQGIGYCFLGG